MATDPNRSGPPALPPPMVVELSPRELADLARAKDLLENPSISARIANAVGRPIEEGLKMLPAGWQNVVAKATKLALGKALQVAISSLSRSRSRKSSEGWHKMMVGASGGVGGVFGFAALPVELPVSTTVMLRSIADIARHEGHELSHPDIQLACLEVFALGGPTRRDDGTETSYWAVRAAMAKAISEAVSYLGKRGAIDHTAPVMVRFIASIAARFGVIVSEEVAAKAIPVVGAATGAAVNVLFINHFQAMARGHFIVKRLETKYGRDRVRAVYESIALRA